MKIHEIKKYIKTRIKQIETEKFDYQRMYKQANRHYQVEDSNKYYRWYISTIERIEELTYLLEKIGGEDNAEKVKIK